MTGFAVNLANEYATRFGLVLVVLGVGGYGLKTRTASIPKYVEYMHRREVVCERGGSGESPGDTKHMPTGSS